MLVTNHSAHYDFNKHNQGIYTVAKLALCTNMCFMLLSMNPLKMYFYMFVLKLWMHKCVCKWFYYLKSATWSKGLSPSKPITKIFNNSNNNKIIKWKCFRNTHLIILVSLLKCVIVWLLCCLNFWSNTSPHSTRSLRGGKTHTQSSTVCKLGEPQLWVLAIQALPFRWAGTFSLIHHG